jgi:hypothetical protein
MHCSLYELAHIQTAVRDDAALMRKVLYVGGANVHDQCTQYMLTMYKGLNFVCTCHVASLSYQCSLQRHTLF